jgi:hypothetical protein
MSVHPNSSFSGGMKTGKVNQPIPARTSMQREQAATTNQP